MSSLMLLLQRAKEAEGNHKREMTTAALPPMPNENSNPEMKKLPKTILMVKWLEFTAAYVNPAIYIVFTVTFFAVSIILM